MDRPFVRPLGVAAILGLAALAPRTVHLFGQTTSPDEAFTIWMASHPLPQLLGLLRTIDFHPPFSYALANLLLHVTARAYEFRVVSVAFGVTGVVATYFLARRILGDAAWFAGLLVAVCPILIFFDRYYRMYAPLWALSSLSWLLLVRALEAPQRGWRWFGYGMCCACLLYTQYLAFFVLGAQALYVVALHRKTWQYFVAAGCAFASWLPWLPAFLYQLPNGGTAFNQAGTTYADMRLIPGYLLTDGLPPSLEFHPAYLAALWVMLAAAVWLCAGRPQYRLTLWLLLPIVPQAIYGFVAGKYLMTQRYLLQDVFALAIALSVVIVALAMSRLRALGLALGAALVVLMVAGSADKLFVSAYMPVDWTVYGGFLQAHLQPGDVVVFDDIAPYFTLIGSPALRGRKVFLINNANSARAQAGEIARQPRVWLIEYQWQFSDPRHLIFRTLARGHPQTREWMTTAAGYGDVVVTTLFVRPAGRKRGP